MSPSHSSSSHFDAALPLTADDLQQYITAHRIQARLHRAIGHTPTVPAAAAALGVHTDQIVKTLLFTIDTPTPDAIAPDSAPDSAPGTVIVISHGERRIDKRALAGHFGVGRKRIRLAAPEIVLAQLGFPAGGVPPFGHRTSRPMLLDSSVLQLAEPTANFISDPAAVRIFAGGGDDQTMLELTLAELLRVTTPTILSLSEV